MELTWIYVTAASREEALAIGRALVEERLAACANVLAPMTSVCRWRGEVQEDAEVPLIIKTRSEMVAPVTERVLALHSYDCPCVVALPIAGGNAGFLNWIEEQTA